MFGHMLGVVLTVVMLWCSVTSLDFAYHHQKEMEEFLQNINTTYPSISKLYSVGKSIQGRDLWVIALGKSANEEVPLRPNVKYVGNMHGNEAVSREVLLHLIEYLVTNYSSNVTVTDMLDSMLIHIMPTMNPDGFEIASEGMCSGTYGRENGADYDLNRNFPDKFELNKAPLQHETELVMKWLEQYQFVLSANLHGGAVVVNYPYDNYVNASSIRETRYAKCPDDDVFIHMSKVYSNSHGYMYQGDKCGDNFSGGITNGADWYPVTGGMQDYNYVWAGCFEVTIEIGCCKYPMASELPQFWSDNKEALLNYLNLGSTLGVKGLVKDSQGNPVSGAIVTVVGREDFTVKTTPRGEYWRLLLPGNYRIQAEFQNFTAWQDFSVLEDRVSRKDIVISSLYVNKGSVWKSYFPLLITSIFVSVGFFVF